MTIKKLSQAYEAAVPTRSIKITLFLLILFHLLDTLLGIYCRVLNMKAFAFGIILLRSSSSLLDVLK